MLQTRRGPRQKYDVAALQKQQWVEDRMQSCSEPAAWNALLIQATVLFYPKPGTSHWLKSPGACGDLKRTVSRLATHLVHLFPRPPRQHSCRCPLWHSLPSHIREQSDIGSQRLELAQAEQAVKQAKKDRIARFLEEVDSSLAEGDQHVAFKTLKLLQPWKPRDAHN